jgi:hypothetical protein
MYMYLHITLYPTEKHTMYLYAIEERKYTAFIQRIHIIIHVHKCIHVCVSRFVIMIIWQLTSVGRGIVDVHVQINMCCLCM